MIDYTITEEYLLPEGWIYKGTIYFPNGIPYNIIYSEDFSIDIIDPFNLNSIVINDYYGIPVNTAVIQDLGYSLNLSNYETRQIEKIEANLVKNKGFAFSNTVNSITVYLMPTYKFKGATYTGFDTAKIMVTFKLNGIVENFELHASFLPSVRRSYNYTITKDNNAQGEDSVFGTTHSRIVNPENDETRMKPTSGYDFNNVYNDNNINLSANFNYNETVDGLYIGPSAIPSGYEASAVIYTRDNKRPEINSYWYNPMEGVKVTADYSAPSYQPATAKLFEISGTEAQVAYFHDFFSTYSGEYSTEYVSGVVVQKVWPAVSNGLSNILKNRLVLECKLSGNNTEDIPQPDLPDIYGYTLS